MVSSSEEPSQNTKTDYLSVRSKGDELQTLIVL